MLEFNIMDIIAFIVIIILIIIYYFIKKAQQKQKDFFDKSKISKENDKTLKEIVVKENILKENEPKKFCNKLLHQKINLQKNKHL